jgi:hypothetical protein
VFVTEQPNCKVTLGALYYVSYVAYHDKPPTGSYTFLIAAVRQIVVLVEGTTVTIRLFHTRAPYHCPQALPGSYSRWTS